MKLLATAPATGGAGSLARCGWLPGWLRVGAALAATGVLALWLTATIESLHPIERTIPEESIRRGEDGVESIAIDALLRGTQATGWSWLVELRSDSTAAPRASRLEVRRDGAPLGAGHLPHAALRDGVMGWSHWSSNSSGGGDDAGTLLLQRGDLGAGAPDAGGAAGRERVLLRSHSRRWLERAGFGAVVVLVVLLLSRREGALRWTKDAIVRHRLWIGAAIAVAVTVSSLATIVDAPAAGTARWIVAGGLSLFGLPVGASALTPSLRRPLRIVVVMVAAYAATATINAPREILIGAASGAGVDAWWMERALPFAAVGCGVLAWFRPSLIVLMAAMASWRRVAAIELTGFPNVTADWLPVASFALVLGAWLATLGVARIASAWGACPLARETIDGAGGRVLLVAAALHLGHYVASAIEKLRIGADAFDWITGSRTEFLLLASESVGAWSPVAAFGLTERVVHATAAGRIPLNAATLAIEFFPLIAVFRPRWIVTALLALAAMHAGIWMVTGIGFWKWMVVDVALAIGVAAMPRADSETPSRRTSPIKWKRGSLLVLLMLVQPRMMEVVRLGWHDTPALNRVRFEAILDDGSIVPIPATFFASGSYRVACAIFPAPGPTHFPTDTWATTDDVMIRDAADVRGIELEGSVDASDFASRAEAAGIADILRRHHAWALERCDSEGGWNEPLWPHHIIGRALPAPAPSRDRPSPDRDVPRFESVDLRRITDYRVVAESLWLRDPVRGWPEALVRRGVLVVPVAPSDLR